MKALPKYIYKLQSTCEFIANVSSFNLLQNNLSFIIIMTQFQKWYLALHRPLEIKEHI